MGSKFWSGVAGISKETVETTSCYKRLVMLEFNEAASISKLRWKDIIRVSTFQVFNKTHGKSQEVHSHEQPVLSAAIPT